MTVVGGTPALVSFVADVENFTLRAVAKYAVTVHALLTLPMSKKFMYSLD